MRHIGCGMLGMAWLACVRKVELFVFFFLFSRIPRQDKLPLSPVNSVGLALVWNHRTNRQSIPSVPHAGRKNVYVCASLIRVVRIQVEITFAPELRPSELYVMMVRRI